VGSLERGFVEIYCHTVVFLAVIRAGSMDNWYANVKEEIRQQQEDPVWMSEDKVGEVFNIT